MGFSKSGRQIFPNYLRECNKCIDVPSASFDDLAHVHQWDCHGGDHQLWELVELEDALLELSRT